VKRLRIVLLLALVGGLVLGARFLPGAEGLLERLEALGSGGPLSGAALARALGLLALATLVSEDLTCLAAGTLVARGSLPFVPAAAACFLGILGGDVLLFLCGRWFGRPVLARAPVRWFLDERRVDEAARWLERRGGIVILTSRFLPGARLPTYFASGALGTGLVRFTLWFALAGILWTPALVALAAGLGGGLERGLGLGPGDRRVSFDGAAAWSLFVTIGACWLVVALARSLATWRGRALWRARLRRWTRFEYWPVGLYYLPVFGLFLARALRGRALEFTAANPALPHGGFVGESKAEIQALLEAAGAPLPRTLLLPAGESAARHEALQRFLRETGVGLPLVVKPDAGQRGEGVRIVRTAEALEQALAESHEALVVQEFVPGEEYGLFFARFPGEEPGRLISLTHKVLPEVTGDGRRTLERLILEDPVHRAMAAFFLARNARALERVPAAGERVQIGELGTHCRGARFLDGSALATPELVEALERIVRRAPGFCFGRFDVRAASPEELRAGRFTVIELNGVTSEAAHVYDPRYTLPRAWAALLAQWRLAYAIGAENARRGARVSRLGELRRAIADYRALAAGRVEAAPPRAAGTDPGGEGALAQARG